MINVLAAAAENTRSLPRNPPVIERPPRLIVAPTNRDIIVFTNSPMSGGEIPSLPAIGSVTNGQQAFEHMFVSSIQRYEQQLANPNLHPHTRSAIEGLLRDAKERLADFRENAGHWEKLHVAKRAKDPERIAGAEEELNAYLEKRQERVHGTNTSSSSTQEKDPRIAYAVIGGIAALPLIALVFYFVRLRKKAV